MVNIVTPIPGISYTVNLMENCDRIHTTTVIFEAYTPENNVHLNGSNRKFEYWPGFECWTDDNIRYIYYYESDWDRKSHIGYAFLIRVDDDGEEIEYEINEIYPVEFSAP